MNTPLDFDVPATIVHGGGSRRDLPRLIARTGASRVLIVSDPGVRALGFVDDVCQVLESSGLEVAVFDDVQPDPTDRNVEAGVEALRAHDAACVLALGGGSPIDTAKVIAVRAANPGPMSDYMGLHKIPHSGLPLIAVPTTAGTGSEATKVAVITDSEREVKMMMLSRALLPWAAVVDYELSLGMPPPLTAAVGVDTLTHGIEAYVSRKANAMTDPIALSCIRLVGQYLVRAWDDPNDHEARAGMMLAATQGGMAFSNSSVCLVHGMSRPIGAVFHLPHGLSNAMLLPAVTRYSVEAGAERYATIARILAPEKTADADDVSACHALVDWLDAFNRRLAVPRLSEAKGVQRERFEASVAKMADDALASGSPANNPRVPTAAEIIDLYHAAW